MVATLESRSLRGPIAALCFIRDGILLAAHGPQLVAYNIRTAQPVCTVTAFEQPNIHLICYDAASGHLALLGAKKIALYKLAVSGDDSTVEIRPLRTISLRDWVKAVHFVRQNGSGEPQLLAVTAHNWVEQHALQDGDQVLTVQCEEKCILYAAKCYGQDVGTVRIAVGTVFNEILLWDMASPRTPSGEARVLRRLRGHEGVIFSLEFSPNGEYLASVSDDRSIRLWSMSNDSNGASRAFFGHTARVWQCTLTDDLLFSVAEDSTCRLWRYAGQAEEDEAIGCWEGHEGKNVWSVAVNASRSVVATGGNDAGIRLWSLASVHTTTIDYEDQMLTVRLPKHAETLGGIRNAVLMGSDRIIAATHSGQLCLYDVAAESWTVAYSDVLFEKYAMLGASPCGRLAVAGSIDGHLCLIAHGETVTTLVVKAGAAKVYSIHVLADPQDTPGSFHVFVHLHPNSITWYRVTVNAAGQIEAKHRLVFDAPVSGLFLDMQVSCDGSVLVATSRCGSLLAYQLDGSCGLAPCVQFSGAHGREAVTSVLPLESTNAGHTFVTTGRDGAYCKWLLAKSLDDTAPVLPKSSDSAGDDELVAAHQREYLASQDKRSAGDVPLHVKNQTVRLQRKFDAQASVATQLWGTTTYSLTRTERDKLTKGWLEKALLVDNELLFVTFFQKRMNVLGTSSRQSKLSVACGGAHRQWDIRALDKDLNNCTFCYVRKENIVILRREGTTVLPFKRSQLVPSFHGREVRCVLSLLQHGSRQMVITGAEDTLVRVTNLDTGAGITYQKHVSVVRSMATSTNRSTTLLFTAGGLEELIAWRVSTNRESGTTTLIEQASCPPVSAMLESRVMSLVASAHAEHAHLHVLCAGYSDGTLRVLLYDEQAKRFHVVATGTVDRCILSVQSVDLKGSTDGQLYMWDTSEATRQFVSWYTSLSAVQMTTMRLNEYRQHAGQLPLPTAVKMHQSGINAFDVAVNAERDTLTVVSGGDDNAVSYAELAYHRDSQGWQVTAQESLPNAHASSVTGIAFLRSAEKPTFVSVAVDQRINVWTKLPGVQRPTLDQGHYLSVADVSDLDVVQTQPNNWRAVVVGLGMQTLDIVL
ncbi:WD repeat-containing protein 6 [Sorochytrium milnesiophthora]